MENLTRDTINKIEEMSKTENKIVEVDGKTYSKDKLYEVKSERDNLRSINTSSLSGFVSYVKHMIKNRNQPLPIIINIDSDGVVAKSGLIDGWDRDTVATASPSPVRNDYGTFKSLEETIIALQTKFIRTQTVENLLSTLQHMVVDNAVSIEDDGVSQRVTVANGAGIKSEIKLSPIVRLQPYTTFFELEQPERLFLLRVNKEGYIALFEADGDVYKQIIIDNTNYFLKQSFVEEINNELVVIA